MLKKVYLEKQGSFHITTSDNSEFFVNCCCHNIGSLVHFGFSSYFGADLTNFVLPLQLDEADRVVAVRLPCRTEIYFCQSINVSSTKVQISLPARFYISDFGILEVRIIFKIIRNHKHIHFG